VTHDTGHTAPEGGEAPGIAPDPYRELFERSADAILMIEDDTFVDCNQATVEMLRYRSKEELLKTHPSELSPPFQPDGRSSFEKANEILSIAFERGSHRFEWDHLRADGEVFPVEVLLTPIDRGGRRILHVVWRDLTERKRLETELRHAQKMEAIGKLAGGVAHDFNNLLVAILGNAGLLARKVAERPELRKRVTEIRRAGERASALVQQLLAFSRKQELRVRVIDLNETLNGTHALLARLLSEDIELVTRAAPEALRVEAGPGQVEQVLMNLTTNARDAMPAGGRLEVRLRRRVLDGGDAGYEDLAPGAYAEITVVDSGEGMTTDVLERAFDPFFTTKEMGRGTGLGLSTVYGIVEQARGCVRLDSTPGEGTIARVLLPLTAKPVTEAFGSAPARRDAASVGRRILVVEDHAAVARLVASVLREEGFEVELAADGQEALEAWREQKDPCDLILSDVIMPRMSGPEMLKHMRREGYTGPVLFASGYTRDELEVLRSMGEDVDLLEKPFDADELLVRIREAVERDRADAP
jgi:PAS domain S-box-containing protein